MNAPHAALLVGLLSFAGCGPRSPGPHPNETMFWRITSSAVELTACTDDPAFRSQIEPIGFDDNTYLIYRVDPEAKKATSLDCERLDVKTCQDSSTQVVFDIATHELLYAAETKSPIGKNGCQLQGAQSWLLTDQGTTLSMEISNVLSLVDDPTDCPAVEAQIKRQSPNGVGVQGCIVKYSVGARFD